MNARAKIRKECWEYSHRLVWVVRFTQEMDRAFTFKSWQEALAFALRCLELANKST